MPTPFSSDAPEATRWDRLAEGLQRWRSVTQWLAVGLATVLLGAQRLAATRFRSTPLSHAAWVGLDCAAVLYLALQLLHLSKLSAERSEPSTVRNKWPFMLLAVGIGLSIWQSARVWAAPLLGLSTAHFLWLLSKSGERSCVLPVAGWLWAGLYPLSLAWPNEQRLYLAFLIGGIATTLQGVWDVFRYLLPHPARQPVA